MLPELTELLEVLDQAKERLAEADELYDSLLAGQRPSRIPIAASSSSYIYHLPHLGVAPEDYFSDPETALRTELRARSWCLREFPEEDVSGVAVGIHRESNSTVASAFCEVTVFHDAVGGYMVEPALETIKDVNKLRVPRPEDLPAVQRVASAGDYFRRQLDGHIEFSVPVPIMPFTDASAIRGDTQFIYDLVDHPREAKLLLEIAVETQIRTVKYFRERLGLPEPDGIGIGDDGTSYLSPQMYEEFAVPYELMAVKELSKTGRVSGVHICGPSMHLLDVIKRELNPQTMLISYYGNIAEASPIMGSTALRGNADPRVVRDGTLEKIRGHVIECLEQGSQHGPYYFSSGTESWLTGTPVESIHYVYSVIKEYERQHREDASG